MRHKATRSRYSRLLPLLICSAALTACGSGGGSSNPESSELSGTSSTSTNTAESASLVSSSITSLPQLSSSLSSSLSSQISSSSIFSSPATSSSKNSSSQPQSSSSTAALAIDTPANVQLEEGGQLQLAATPEGSITFQLVSAGDSSLFTLSSDGLLKSLTPLDFESPTDTNGDNHYELTVNALGSGSTIVSKDITIEVTDIAEISATVSFPPANSNLAALKSTVFISGQLLNPEGEPTAADDSAEVWVDGVKATWDDQPTGKWTAEAPVSGEDVKLNIEVRDGEQITKNIQHHLQNTPKPLPAGQWAFNRDLTTAYSASVGGRALLKIDLSNYEVNTIYTLSNADDCDEIASVAYSTHQEYLYFICSNILDEDSLGRSRNLGWLNMDTSVIQFSDTSVPIRWGGLPPVLPTSNNRAFIANEGSSLMAIDLVSTEEHRILLLEDTENTANHQTSFRSPPRLTGENWVYEHAETEYASKVNWQSIANTEELPNSVLVTPSTTPYLEHDKGAYAGTSIVKYAITQLDVSHDGSTDVSQVINTPLQPDAHGDWPQTQLGWGTPYFYYFSDSQVLARNYDLNRTYLIDLDTGTRKLISSTVNTGGRPSRYTRTELSTDKKKLAYWQASDFILNVLDSSTGQLISQFDLSKYASTIGFNKFHQITLDWESNTLFITGHHSWNGTNEDDAAHIIAINLDTEEISTTITGADLRSFFELPADATFTTTNGGVVLMPGDILAFTLRTSTTGDSSDIEEHVVYFDKNTDKIVSSLKTAEYNEFSPGSADYLITDHNHSGHLLLGDWEEGIIHYVNPQGTYSDLRTPLEPKPASVPFTLLAEQNRAIYWETPREFILDTDGTRLSDWPQLDNDMQRLIEVELTTGKTEVIATRFTHPNLMSLIFPSYNLDTELYLGGFNGYLAVIDPKTDQTIILSQ